MIDQEPFKLCPECGGEFRFDVERCADCEVPLVFPQEIAARDARELPTSPWLVILRTAPILWVRALASDLDRAGVRYRVDRRRARDEGLLTLSVRWQDRQAAKAIDEARLRIEDPRGELSGAEEPEELRQDIPSYKVCPDCGGEYRLDATRCADCGSALISPDPAGGGEDGDDGASEQETDEWLEAHPDLIEQIPYSGPIHELAPSDDLVCLCCRSVKSIQTLSQALDLEEISHRLEPAPFGSKSVNCLYVMPFDADRAAAVDDSLWNAPLEGDPPAELTSCPACGTPHALGDSQCSGCGLVLGAGVGIDVTCSRCGAVIGVAALNCPNCAASMPRAFSSED